MFTEQDIIDYYDINEVHYRAYWRLDKCLAMHYGYHDKENKSFAKALINMNKQLAKRVGITKNDSVLDAGCGVGGSSIFLAKNYGAKAHGITLSAKQVITASNYAKKHSVENLASFSEDNYRKTKFEDESFDVVWAVESVCQSVNKEDFYKEAFRLLKPGGRLLVSDYFEEEEVEDSKKVEFKKWLDSWSIDSLTTLTELKSYLSAFTSFNIEDASKFIWPSARYMYFTHYLGMIPHRIYDLIFGASAQSEKNFQSAKYQYLALKKGAWRYRIITAVK